MKYKLLSLSQRQMKNARRERDSRGVVKKFPVRATPARASLQQHAPTPYDQGQLGSCTANAICAAIKMISKKDNPSRLFVYTREEIIDDGIIVDDGADAWNGCSDISTTGVCEESFMPYDMDSNGNVKVFGKTPSAAAYNNAQLHKYPKSTNVTHSGPLLDTIKACIMENSPVLVAFLVFPSFDNIRADGIMPMPTTQDLQDGPEGGHEVLCVGYDENSIILLNSWSANWGKNGYFHMPNEYLLGNWHGEKYVMQIIQFPSIVSSAINTKAMLRTDVAKKIQTSSINLNRIGVLLRTSKAPLPPAVYRSVQVEIDNLQSLLQLQNQTTW